MNTPMSALAWEIWRKNRYGFWLLFGLLLACSALTRLAVHFGTEAAQLATTLATDAPELIEAMARASGLREMANSWGIFLFGGSLLVTFAVFAFVDAHASRGFSGIPSRLFSLPVKTVHLVGLPVIAGVAFVAVLYLAWSQLVLKPLLPVEQAMPDGYLLLLLTASLAAFQLLVWILPNFPKTRVVLLTILITATIYLSALPFGGISGWPETEPVFKSFFVAALLISPAVAVTGVSRLRRGDWSDWAALTALMTRVANVFSRRREFASPAGALFWIQFRRIGIPALGTLVVVVGLVLCFASLATLIDGASTKLDLFGMIASPIVMFLVSIWIPVVGLLMASDGVNRRLHMATFQGVRPVAIGDLVLARLRAMTALWLGGWLFSALVIGGAAVVFGRTDDLLNRFTSVWDLRVLVIMIVISFHALIGLLPLWLTGRVPDLPWSFFGLLVVYAAMAQIIAWFERHPNLWQLAFLAIGFAGAVKLGLAAIGFREALAKRWVTRRFVFGTVATWVVGTALFLSLLSELCSRANWDESIVLPFAALLFPLARIALAPLALSMNRHR
jgi:hypothetical protein